MMKKTKIKLCIRILCYVVVFLAASCVDGYKDDNTFNPGVENTQLESPKAEGIVITPNPTGTEVSVTWPVVIGAGGYQFSLYISDDPENPIPVGQENQIVDGCLAKRELMEDTKYKIVIKTIGNEVYNNKGSESAVEIPFTTLVDATLIPAGTDLTTYFTENPYESGAAFELQGGADYTMSGNINFGVNNIVIRGNKVNHAKVNITSGAKFISTGAGIKFKFLDFDLSSSTAEMINYTTLDASMPTTGSQPYSVANPVLIEACNVTGMINRWISGGSGNFFINSVTIKNCVFDMKLASTFVQLGGNGHIKDFEISSSTFDNEEGASTSQRFLQYGNGNISKGALAASLTMTNNTFYNISYAQAMANYGMMRQKSYTVTAKKNIFVNCGNQKVISGFVGGNGSPIRVCDQNAYWYNGAFPSTETSDANGDNSKTLFKVDPGFSDPATGKFTISAPALVAARIGDPRWIP